MTPVDFMGQPLTSPVVVPLELPPFPWGVLAYGDVIGEYGGGLRVVMGFDRRGEPLGSVGLSGGGFGSESIASNGIENWALSSWGGNLRLFEFGCVLDD